MTHRLSSFPRLGNFRSLPAVALFLSLSLGYSGFAQETPTPPAASENSETETDLPPCDCHVWCALIVGLKPDTPRPAVPELPAHAEVREQLKKAFPDYTGFEILGDKSEPILKEYDCWVVPTDKLFIKVDSLGEDPEGLGGIHVHLQIWHETNVLVKSDAILRKNPIFFVGPKLGEDQLILALMLTEEEQPEEKGTAKAVAPAD